ncbi:MAG: FAD-dependent thymidylate synthase, partial [Methanomassiliicoccales archaeon]|nr:FAD-dependent thymidylate synthase [Methanomassiliicoccales archaeon]
MKVVLLSYTNDAERLCAAAARSCYSPDAASEILEGVEEDKAGAFIDKVVGMGHHSVIEHASYTFSLEGVSRSLTHQLVRHRIASYSQQSQRYVS